MKWWFNKKVIGAVAFILVVYWPLSSMLFCMKYDMVDWFLPMRNLVGACLQEHLFPLWNPYTNLGYPLHIDPQSGAMYPIVWVLGYCFGYNSYTINLEFLLHLVLAFWGMRKLGQQLSFSENVSLLLGVTYACCGFFVSNAQHLTWIISATWIPYILATYLSICKNQEWRDGLALALWMYLLLTGGYPAFLITLVYGLCVAFLFQIIYKMRHRQYSALRFFLGNHVLAIVFFALQALAFGIYFWEALPELQRLDGLKISDIQYLPFSPQSFISFYFPMVTGGNVEFLTTDISMANAYIGIIGLFLVLYGMHGQLTWKKGLLIGIAILFFLIAMGPYFYFRELLYHYVPLMNLFKYPSLFRLFAMIALLLFMGITLERIRSQASIDFFNKKASILLSALLASGLVLWVYSMGQSSFVWPQNFQVKTLGDFIQSARVSQLINLQFPIQFTLLILFWTAFKYGAAKKRWTYFFLLIAIDLFLSVQLNLFSTAVSDATTEAFEQRMNQLPNDFPIPDLPPIQVGHDGQESLYPIWYNKNILQRKVAHNGYNNFKLNTFRVFYEHPLKEQILGQSIVHLSPAFINRDSSSWSTATLGQVDITHFSPIQIKAKVVVEAAQQINLLQTNYPGWSVEINGVTVPHFTTDGIFISAKIPTGQHEVSFQFYPKYFSLYLSISVLSFIFVLFAIGIRRPVL